MNTNEGKQGKSIPRVNLNPDNLNADNLFEIWWHLTSDLFDTQPINKPQDFVFKSNCYNVQDLVFTNVYFDNLLFKRTLRQLSAGESDFILLQYYQQGQQTGLVDSNLTINNHSAVISIDVMQAMMDFRLQQDLTDANKFKEWLQKENLDNQAFQNRVVLGLKVEKLKEAITAPQVDSYFMEHQASFEEVLLHCVITPDQELSQQIKQRLIIDDISIEDLAKEYSNSETNIRFFKQQVQRRALGKEVRGVLATVVKGDLLGPISLNNNWSLFKVVDVIPGQLDDKIKKQIETQLFAEWLVKKLRDMKIEFKSIPESPTQDPLAVV